MIGNQLLIYSNVIIGYQFQITSTIIVYERLIIKTCSACKQPKNVEDFYLNYRNKDGLKSVCKICESEAKKRCYIKYRQRIREQQKAYNLKNKEKKSIRAKEWRLKNPERNKFLIARARKEWIKKPQNKLIVNIRCRMNRAIKGQFKSNSTTKSLGCTIVELKIYLESKFQPNMSWDNYGEWHLDHIKPLASFDLNNPDEYAKACHYTNLQPLWAIDNIKKSDSLEWGDYVSN